MNCLVETPARRGRLHDEAAADEDVELGLVGPSSSLLETPLRTRSNPACSRIDMSMRGMAISGSCPLSMEAWARTRRRKGEEKSGGGARRKEERLGFGGGERGLRSG